MRRVTESGTRSNGSLKEGAPAPPPAPSRSAEDGAGPWGAFDRAAVEEQTQSALPLLEEAEVLRPEDLALCFRDRSDTQAAFKLLDLDDDGQVMRCVARGGGMRALELVPH